MRKSLITIVSGAVVATALMLATPGAASAAPDPQRLACTDSDAVLDFGEGSPLAPAAAPVRDGQSGQCPGTESNPHSDPVRLVCDIVNSVLTELDATPELPVSEPIASGIRGAAPFADNCASASGGPSPTGNNPPGSPQVKGAVLENNAGIDGGLPRTGGEMFAGAGSLLVAAGAALRRRARR